MAVCAGRSVGRCDERADEKRVEGISGGKVVQGGDNILFFFFGRLFISC